MRSKPRPHISLESFPIHDRFTASGHCVGEVCFECRCRIAEFEGPNGILLAWCECSWPEDHHEMEILDEPVN